MSDAPWPAAPMTTDVDAVLGWLAHEPTTEDGGRVAQALVEALLIEGHEFLDRAATYEDAVLFLDIHDHPRGVEPLVRVTRIVSEFAARFPNETPSLVATSAERARHALTR